MRDAKACLPSALSSACQCPSLQACRGARCISALLTCAEAGLLLGRLTPPRTSTCCDGALCCQHSSKLYLGNSDEREAEAALHKASQRHASASQLLCLLLVSQDSDCHECNSSLQCCVSLPAAEHMRFCALCKRKTILGHSVWTGCQRPRDRPLLPRRARPFSTKGDTMGACFKVRPKIHASPASLFCWRLLFSSLHAALQCASALQGVHSALTGLCRSQPRIHRPADRQRARAERAVIIHR